jgi:DNA (cytosine-5)-methyltransferase 1
MKYASVCSGVEAASLAWEPLGWRPLWFSEIEKFPSAVLAERWPDVPNLGDMTAIEPGEAVREYGRPDVLVGGTPCQAFSAAGLRRGLDDPRGSLMLVFLRLARDLGAPWLVWENVPGVLSNNGGRDFGTFLGALGQLGFRWAYRVLDAQYAGLAQRRKRVFVVGRFGEGPHPGSVLFERASLRGDPAPRREAGAGVARCLRSQSQSSHREDSDNYVTHTLCGEGFDAGEDGTGRGTPLTVAYQCHGNNVGPMGTLREGDGGVTSGVPFVASVALRGRDGGATAEVLEDGTAHALRASSGGGDKAHVLTVLPFDTTQITHPENRSNPSPGDPSPTLAKQGHPQQDPIHSEDCALPLQTDGCASAVMEPMAFDWTQGGSKEMDRPPSMTLSEQSPTLSAVKTPAVLAPTLLKRHSSSVGTTQDALTLAGIAASGTVRRLMPVECERLQGMPDGHTDVTYRGKPASDGPRYKAIGNSMAVPIMEWIGKRIELVQLAHNSRLRTTARWSSSDEGRSCRSSEREAFVTDGPQSAERPCPRCSALVVSDAK